MRRVRFASIAGGRLHLTSTSTSSSTVHSGSGSLAPTDHVTAAVVGTALAPVASVVPADGIVRG